MEFPIIIIRMRPILIFRGGRSNFSFLFRFSMKFLYANIAPDGTPRFAMIVRLYALGILLQPTSSYIDRKVVTRSLWSARKLDRSEIEQ